MTCFLVFALSLICTTPCFSGSFHSSPRFRWPYSSWLRTRLLILCPLHTLLTPRHPQHWAGLQHLVTKRAMMQWCRRPNPDHASTQITKGPSVITPFRFWRLFSKLRATSRIPFWINTYQFLISSIPIWLSPCFFFFFFFLFFASSQLDTYSSSDTLIFFRFTTNTFLFSPLLMRTFWWSFLLRYYYLQQDMTMRKFCSFT